MSKTGTFLAGTPLKIGSVEKQSLYMKGLVLFAFVLLSSFVQDGIENLLLGRWVYAKGSYEYYDSGDHKLKESAMNAIDDLEIMLEKDNAATISFSGGRSRNSTYALSKSESGTWYISANLSGNPFKYQVLSITENSLVLSTRTPSSFFIDGDVSKKVAYCLIKIYLTKKIAGS